MRVLLLVLILLIASVCANAEVEKIAIPCEERICLVWWPKLPAVRGWHQDRDSSLRYDANAQAPDGKVFADAATVMYAKALYTPRMGAISTLQDLVDSDQRQFRSDFPGVRIVEAEPIATGDGRVLQSFIYLPEKSGNWERVSYGEDGEFFLIFTVSSRSQQGLLDAMGDYRKFVTGYQTGPRHCATAAGMLCPPGDGSGRP